MEEINRKIEEVIVNNETVYLKKDSLGWHTVFPNRNKDGSINWKNLIAGGSWIKFFLVVGFVILCLAAIFEVSHVYKVANDCLNQTRLNWNLK